MSRVFVYTFRTNPYVANLEKCGARVFVLGKLRKDIKHLLDEVARKKPGRIVGVALVRGREGTRAEVEAINQFGCHGKKVHAQGRDAYALINPDPQVFKDARTPTHSFCNWTAYKVAESLVKGGYDAQHSFIHFCAADVELLYGHISRDY